MYFSSSIFFNLFLSSIASFLDKFIFEFINSKITFWSSSLRLANSLAFAIVKFPFSSTVFSSGIRLLLIFSYLPTCVGDSFKSLAIISFTLPVIFSPLAFFILYSSFNLWTCLSFSISVNSLVCALACIRIISASVSLT